jgi:hypothetical protein
MVKRTTADGITKFCFCAVALRSFTSPGGNFLGLLPRFTAFAELFWGGMLFSSLAIVSIECNDE